MSQQKNHAAYIPAAKADLVCKEAPYPQPGEGEILLRNQAVAINPLEYNKQDSGSFIFEWMPYPFIMGTDTSGEVVAVGPGVTRFKPGDRVTGVAAGMAESSKRAEEGAFQEFLILRTQLCSPIPASMSPTQASVIGTGVSTAACALFGDDQLQLQLPKPAASKGTVTVDSSKPTVLVWGGSSSVGSNAIQLANAAGYPVVTTCSPRNFDFVKSLGAEHVFDYRSPTCDADLAAILKTRTVAGAISVGTDGLWRSIEALAAAKDGHRHVAQAGPGVDGFPRDLVPLMGTVARFLWHNVSTTVLGRWRGVSSKFLNGLDVVTMPLGAAIFETFLPQALATGQFKPAPEPLVVGHGVEAIQGAVDRARKGVSAKKVVVTLGNIQ